MMLGLIVAVCLRAEGVAAQPSPTAIVDRVRVNTARAIDFHAAAFPESVYVGQQITYQVAVLLSEDARARLRRDPEFRPPELRGLLAYELGTPRRVPAREYDGRRYEAHVFQRALFGIAPGVLTVPAPQLTYYLSQSSSYFSREERNVVHAESAQLVVKPLPDEGRPVDFSGAVGVLQARVRFDETSARVGDPLMLTVRLEGTGNVKLLPRPVVELPWASVVAGSERVQIDSSGALVRGAKEFDFILTPTRAGAVVLPIIHYPYFDPYRAEYAWAESMPADLQIADGALVAPSEIDESTRLPLRSWQVHEARPGYVWSPTERLVLLGIWLGTTALAAGAGWRRRRAARMRGDTRMTASAPVPATVDESPGAMARDLRRTLLRQLAGRLQVPAGALVVRRDVERILRRRGVTRQSTREVLELLDHLAVEGFGPGLDRSLGQSLDQSLDRSASQSSSPSSRSSANDSDLRARVERVFKLVDDEAMLSPVSRWLTRRGLRAMLLLTTVTASMTSARRGVAQQAVDTGVRVDVPLLVREATAAYEARRYSTAAERFAEAAARRPRDVDLLVNWGTAAWSAGDTVSAVVAWQRAARLEPLAIDVQERLGLLPPGARGGIAEVPMVPVALLVVIATVCWCLGIVVLIVVWTRGSTNDRGIFRTSVGGAAMLVATGLALSAWWGARALDPEGLAVVRRPEAMRVQPASDANTAGGLATGDIVRLAGAHEQWARVEHADGRFGWVPAERLTRLVPDGSPR